MSLLLFVPKVTGSKLVEHSHYIQDDRVYYSIALRFESGKGSIINSYDYDHTLFDELKGIDEERIKVWLASKFKGIRNKPMFYSTAFYFKKRRDDSFSNYCYYGMSVGVDNVGEHHSKLFDLFSNLDMTEVRDWFNMKIDGINKSTKMPNKIKCCGDD